MISYLARGVTRVVALVVLPLLGVAALAFAVAAIAGGHTSASVARSTDLTSAWRQVGTFLAHVAPAGRTVVVLGAVGAVLLGVIVLIGALVPSGDREVRLEDGGDTLRIHRRALRNALRAEVGPVPGTTKVTVRLHVRRRRNGGRVRVSATRTPRASADQVTETIRTQLGPLTSAFELRSRIRTSVGRNRKARTE